VFTLFDHAFSWRDMILIAGGLFLVWKATKEIHHATDPSHPEGDFVTETVTMSMGTAIFQILLLDLVFSIDSIITAVGMTDEIGIMVIAVVVAVAWGLTHPPEELNPHDAYVMSISPFDPNHLGGL
jgi:predicted tellurium resistance membrane protein TerC